MDIDVVYTLLFEAMARMRALLDMDPDMMGDQARHGHAARIRVQAEEVAEQWATLDEWLKAGGFAPQQWDPARKGK